jgi:hypothetical protein
LTYQKGSNIDIRSFCPGTFEQWSRRIVTTAKDLCNDSGGKRIKLIKSKDSVTYDIKPKDKEAIDCIIKSIRIYLVLMPPNHQEIFRKQIPELEKFKSVKKSWRYE